MQRKKEEEKPKMKNKRDERRKTRR